MRKIKLVVVRAGFLGDSIVVLPYIFYYIAKNNIQLSEVHFISLQKIKNGSQGNKSIFTELLGNSVNSSVIKNYSFFDLIRTLRHLKLSSNYNFIYLPFVLESKFSRIKKYLFFSLAGVPVYRIKFIKGYRKNLSEYSFFFSNSSDLSHGVSLMRNFFYSFMLSQMEDVLKDFRDSIVIYPNSQYSIKKWPLNNYYVLIRELTNIYSSKIILIGSKDDTEYNLQIVNHFSSCRIIDYSGKLSFIQNIQALRIAKVFIGNDGGPMHLAAAAGTPVVALFTYREILGLWDPIITSFISIRTTTSCKHCNLISCDNNICISMTGVETVTQGISDVLEGSSYIKINY